MLSGGSWPKICFRQAAATSREPPLVRVVLAGALDGDAEDVFHFATHSSFHGSLPSPSKGLTLPWWPQPLAHFTRFGRQV